MSERQAAEEHLRVIRSLMERSTIYRAISAPTALVAGVSSIAAAYVLVFADGAGLAGASMFLSTWLTVLAVTLSANFLFLWRAARRRNEVFISSGMRMAFRSVTPAFLCAAVLTLVHAGNAALLPNVWILFYGLGLLATGHFAPRSISLLGWAFVLAGMALWFKPAPFGDGILSVFVPPVSAGSMEMGFTFGVFHLLYAIGTLAAKPAADQP